MADKGKNIPGPHHNRFAGGLNPAVIEGVIKNELRTQANFASTWGELIPKEHGSVPKDTDEAIEMKRQQIEKLKEKVGVSDTPATYQSSYAAKIDATAKLRLQGKGPEDGYGDKYKVMRAGV